VEFVTAVTRELEHEVRFAQLLSPADVDGRRFQHFLKRALDLTASAIILALLALPAALIALAIKVDSPGSVFVVQTRTGRYGRPFRMVKFRTMCVNAEQMKVELQALNEAEGPIFKVRNDPRMTRVGRLLRKTSIDELPQLWNVLTGDMSLVGPRPPLPSEVSAYSEYHLGRLAAKPGMTGLWQVSGRSLLGFTEMVDLDLAYIRGWHLGRDIAILVRTLPAVISGRGAF
jgi:lipopolysaccharide/colanic/teichoic acid biosynthesis glycosyltransferase